MTTANITIVEPTRYDFVVMRGDDWGPWTVAVKDENNVAIDLSGSTFYWTIRRVLPDSIITDDSDADAQEITVVGATPPHLSTTIGIGHADDYGLLGVYNYDIQWVDANDIVTTLMYGFVTFIGDCTRTQPR